MVERLGRFAAPPRLSVWLLAAAVAAFAEGYPASQALAQQTSQVEQPPTWGDPSGQGTQKPSWGSEEQDSGTDRPSWWAPEPRSPSPFNPPQPASSASNDGPSFDCNGRLNRTERRICNNPQLAALDVEMAGLYSRVVTSELGEWENIRDAQRSWLRTRNKCGADDQCLIETYESQIAYFKEFLTAEPMPDLHTASYRCENGAGFSVRYDNRGSESLAYLLPGDGSEIMLPQVISGSGSRYSNGRLTVHTKAATALLIRGEQTLRCTAD